MTALFTIVMTLQAIPARAQATRDSILIRLEALERMMSALDARVRQLEGQVQTSQVSGGAPIQVAPGAWRDRQNWRRLKAGMTMDEVRALLGEPEKVEAGALVHWYWQYPGGPEVYFNSITQRLMGWTEP
jgi:hypothetical protein